MAKRQSEQQQKLGLCGQPGFPGFPQEYPPGTLARVRAFQWQKQHRHSRLHQQTEVTISVCVFSCSPSSHFRTSPAPIHNASDLILTFPSINHTSSLLPFHPFDLITQHIQKCHIHFKNLFHEISDTFTTLWSTLLVDPLVRQEE